MNLKEIKDLIDFLAAKDVAELEFERGDVKLRLKRSLATVQAAPVAAAAAAAAAASVSRPSLVPSIPASPAGTGEALPAEMEEAGIHVLFSPMVGTFYEAASPDTPPFVNVGDTVQAGQPLCIVEAMKLMNEIEADVSGVVVRRFVNNAQPVEYGQPLFAIRPGV
jgi:acetyl-CoA carboxylase biotin carboxyl carrier protein